MKNKIINLPVALAILCLLLSSCNFGISGTDFEVKSIGGETITVSSDGKVIQGEIPPKGKEIVSELEIVNLNNCGGVADVKRIAERTTKINWEAGGEIGLEYKDIIEAKLLAKYGEEDVFVRSIELLAPPVSNMEYVLSWSVEREYGVIEIPGSGAILVETKYKVRYYIDRPLGVDLVSSKNLGCQ